MEITLRITDLARSGAGLGRDESGRVVFVPFTAPGDLVRAAVTQEEKRYAEARLVEVLEPSPHRATPPCPAFGRCGGCEWQHLPYATQWETKRAGVKHALERVEVPPGELPWDDFPAERVWEYRNRIQLKGFRDDLGFYARGTNQIVPVEKCWIARPEINDRLLEARARGASRPREYKLELEVFPGGEVTESWNQGHSARGFRQVHDEQNAKLQGWVAANAASGGTLLDLYGGAGNLSLALAGRFDGIHCVDVGAPSPAPEGTPAGLEFHRFEVLAWLRREASRLRGLPLRAVLDPPRDGMGPDLAEIVDHLRKLEVREILLIGCETDSWARAVSRFVRRGWTPTRAGALDFFPQTHHVESLAKLELR